VLEGSASRTFGPNAFSGAINFITVPADSDFAFLYGTYGNHDLLNLSAVSSYKIKNIKNLFSVSRNSSNGYIENTDFTDYKFYYNGVYSKNNNNIMLQAGVNNKSFGANSFYSSKYPNQFDETSTKFASLKFQTGKEIKFEYSVYYRNNNDHYILIRTNPSVYENFHSTNIFGSNSNIIFIEKFGKTTFGTEIKNENILSSRLGLPLTDSIKVPFSKGKYFYKSFSRSNFSFFAEQILNFNGFNLSGGLLANYNSQRPNKIDFYPGFDLSFNYMKFKIFGSINKSLRMPSFTDLFYESPINTGNINLTPEQAISIEGGVKYLGKYLNVNTGIFVRYGKDIIDWVKLDSAEKWTTKNITTLTTKGFYFYLFSYPSKINSYLRFVELIKLSYNYQNTDKNSFSYISYYALDYLKHKFVFTISHKIFSDLHASWVMNFQQRNGYYDVYDFSLNKYVRKSYKPSAIVDAKVYYTFRRYEIYFETANIFNTEYTDIGGIILPGRWLKAGFKVRIF